MFTDKLLLNSKAAPILDLLKLFFNKHNIPLNNIFAGASDGATSMVCRYRGFSSLLKHEISNQVLTAWMTGSIYWPLMSLTDLMMYND